MSHLPTRRRPTHRPAVIPRDRPPILLVTVATDGRKPILATAASHALIVASWRRAIAWRVGRYVLMPDHLHAFVAPASDNGIALDRWVRCWKSWVSRGWDDRAELPIWQREFWDRQLRAHQGYDAAWTYVAQNPVRKGLVASESDWPFQGVMNELSWDPIR